MKSRLKLLSDDALQQAAERLKVLAHPVRLKIVNVLTQGEFAVHEIAEFVRISPNQTCGHLRLLQAHHLLSSERRGRTVYYNIAAPCVPGILDCVGRADSGRKKS